MRGNIFGLPRLRQAAAPSEKGYQVGGTALLVKGRWAGRVSDVGLDQIGRWSGGHGRQWKGVVPVQPSLLPMHPAPGLDTWWKQLWYRHRAEQKLQNPDPRKIFWDALATYLGPR